jgi:formate dehydrogenase beta subunit
MTTLKYGVWNGKPFDRRTDGDCPIPNINENAIWTHPSPIYPEVLITPQGFAVFNEKASLLDAFLHHYEEVAKNSCGKCTPCRNGSMVIRDELRKKKAQPGYAVDTEELLRISENMEKASDCGIGQTSGKALYGAVRYFASDLFDTDKGSAGSKVHTLVTAPCIEACPAKVDIPAYVEGIRKGRPDLASGVLLKHYPLVGSCGRVCVRFCESACRRQKLDAKIDIKNLKRYAADAVGFSLDTLFQKPMAREGAPRVAVVGAGPAGLVCAYQLLRKGYNVDIFEQKESAGGMARFGIPSYRLPRQVLDGEAKIIKRLGGRFHFDIALGRDFQIQTLFDKGFAAVFLGLGCSVGQKLGYAEDWLSLDGYQNAVDFLYRTEKARAAGLTPKFSGDFIIVGCGNSAMDCCRTARRITSGKVHVVYRRTEKDSSADPEEIIAAKEEGVEFHFLTSQKALVVEENKVKGLRCVETELIPNPAGGRPKLQEKDGSEFVIPASHVIAAIGQKTDPSIFNETPGLFWNERGNIAVNDAFETSLKGVFSAGDCITGAKTLIEAMAGANLAAESIDHYLKTGTAKAPADAVLRSWLKKSGCFDENRECVPLVRKDRRHLASLAPEDRNKHFEEVEQGFTPADARAESERCMRCYRVFSVYFQDPADSTAEGACPKEQKLNGEEQAQGVAP